MFEHIKPTLLIGSGGIVGLLLIATVVIAWMTQYYPQKNFNYIKRY